ncbi:MAG: hypothetical protein NXI24_16455 [bacterium]|nr:hypothetical protein [bacterium]
MQGIWREALHRWKFENDRRLWRLFWSLCITPELLERCRTLKIDRVVWIDSGAAGRQVRNYQPCADVALALTRALAAPGGCGPDLRKKRAGQRSAQSYAERFFSVHNSLEFCGAGEARTYLLVEDVFTTGATANEASRVLKKNGAFHVFVISLLLRDGEAC